METENTKKGFTVLEIIVTIVLLAVFALYATPVFFTPKEKKQEASIRANVAMAVSATTARLALKKKNFTATEVATMTAETLNEHAKNPINKRNKAYTLDAPAEGTVVFIPDNAKKQIEINGYAHDTTKPLITRVVHGYEHNKTQEGTQNK
ncbi:MAG: type II secretion system protein [Candidatus Gastranaerophilales bacterium]|jgi:prepilin-type N-terminal cleavage/methylation domain-containing protein|nr:type II secretion system protein [Candidatus Gastranaerophilales bacterium]